MSEGTHKLEFKGGLAVLTLSNGDSNRIGAKVMADLRDLVCTAEANGVRALLIRGSGDLFCMGADMKEAGARPEAERPARWINYLGALEALANAPFPTVAAVHGVCASGGLELALSCDQIWAAAGTKMGLREIAAATPPLAGVPRLASRAGASRAFEISSSGQFYAAETFELWNIVNRVLPLNLFHAEAEAYAAALATGPTLAYAGVKSLLREWERGGVTNADKSAISILYSLLSTRDFMAAGAALLHDPPLDPVFTGT